jgi:NADPH-dependent F420 reductase
MISKPPVMKTIAVLGGTGKEGKGLAIRWAKAGIHIVIGSRSEEKAIGVAAEILELVGGNGVVEGTTNFKAAEVADIVVLAVPYSVHRATLENVREALQGKILVDVTVPLVPPHVTRVQMPPDGSAAQEAHAILGNAVQVTCAFQNISYEHLLQSESIACDVLVAGTSKEARDETLLLVNLAGLTGWDAGPIENSAVIEGMTSLLIHINKQYASRTAGIKITGVKKGLG